MTENSTPVPPAGWYPDPRPEAPTGMEVYWDGTAWQMQTVRPIKRTPPLAAARTVAPVGEPAAKKPWYKRKAIMIPVGIFAGLVLISSIGNAVGGDRDPVEAEPLTTTSAVPAKEKPTPTPEPVKVEVPLLVGMTGNDAKAAVEAAGLRMKIGGPEQDLAQPVAAQDVSAGAQAAEGTTIAITLTEKPKLSLAQEGAIAKAKSYLRSVGGFSRQGLIDQLLYEQFSVEDATFAVDSSGTDWNAQAAEKAASYMKSVGGFSRGGLYDQLAYEGFTDEQINFGLAAVGF